MLRIFRPRVDAEPPVNFTLRPQWDRAADELVWLCRGVLADGPVSSPEARFLIDLRERNAPARTAGNSGAWSAPACTVEQSNPLLTFSLGFDRLQGF